MSRERGDTFSTHLSVSSSNSSLMRVNPYPQFTLDWFEAISLIWFPSRLLIMRKFEIQARIEESQGPRLFHPPGCANVKPFLAPSRHCFHGSNDRFRIHESTAAAA